MSTEAISQEIFRFKLTNYGERDMVQNALREVRVAHERFENARKNVKIRKESPAEVPSSSKDVPKAPKVSSKLLEGARVFLKSPAGKIISGTIGGVFFGGVEIALEPERYNGNDDRANYRKATAVIRNVIAGLISGGAAGITGAVGIPTTGPLGVAGAFVVGIGVYQGISYPLAYMADTGELLIFGDEAKLQDFARGLPNGARFTGLKFLPLAADYNASASVSKPRTK